MKKKRLFIGSILVGVVCMFLTACNEEVKWVQADNSKKEDKEVLVSNVRKEKCYLCGDAKESLMSYYRGFQSIGLINLNEFNVTELRTRNLDDEGNPLDQAKKYAAISMTNTGGMTIRINPNLGRQYCIANVSVEEWYADVERISNYLCQECLEKAYLTNNSDEPLSNFLIVDFKTLELYSLAKECLSFLVSDYVVFNDRKDDEMKLIVFYAPEED